MLNKPLQMFLVMLAGWMNEQQRAVNFYLKEGRRVLREFEPIVTPDTILRWHRELIARILRERGIEPAPKRLPHMPWSKFLKAHWEAIAAADFFHDRDPLYTRGFHEILGWAGVAPVRLPPKSPNLNAYVEHYHLERCHQGIGNRLIDGVPELASGPVVRQERLGGILSHYHRKAA